MKTRMIQIKIAKIKENLNIFIYIKLFMYILVVKTINAIIIDNLVYLFFYLFFYLIYFLNNLI